ncbi:MAG: hypothetical protein PVSMB2_33270 [Ktedonobacteraceae bacterium]
MSTNQTIKMRSSTTAPSIDGSHINISPIVINQMRRVRAHIPITIVAIIVTLVTLFVHGYRLSAGPDVFSDEGLYLLVGLNLAKGMGLAADHRPFLYHPPAYLLIEAAYLKLMGLTNTDLLTALFSVRNLNVFFSAVTATLLLFFGRKLHSYKAGLIMVALFLMDLYVQRINRRNMLETFTMLCLLAGFYLFFTRQPHLKIWQWGGAGIFLGLTVLSKEAMFAYLPVLLGIIFWTRRTQLIDGVRAMVIAGGLYLCYPLWALSTGEGPAYIGLKFTELGWIIGLPREGNLTVSSQKTASFENVQRLLGQYATSYLLVMLAGIMLIVLFLRFRQRAEARCLLVWSVFSFVYALLLARTSDQYLYFLIVPAAIITNGYSIMLLLEEFPYRHWLHILMPLFLILLFLFNSGEWMHTYGYTSDDGYAKILAYVQMHIPPSEPIVLSNDVGYYLLPSDYDIRFDRDKKNIIRQKEHYFIMSTKDRWGGYNETTPEFYDWVIHNSRPILVEQENTFWTIGLYALNESATNSSVPRSVEPNSTSGKSMLEPGPDERWKEGTLSSHCS